MFQPNSKLAICMYEMHLESRSKSTETLIVTYVVFATFGVYRI